MAGVGGSSWGWEVLREGVPVGGRCGGRRVFYRVAGGERRGWREYVRVAGVDGGRVLERFA